VVLVDRDRLGATTPKKTKLPLSKGAVTGAVPLHFQPITR
jgi:hypothetical protein